MKPFKFALLALLLVVTSCRPGVVLDWINNSGQKLVIVVLNSKSEETDRSTIRQGHAVRTGVPRKLRIEHAGGAWFYVPPPIPGGLWKHKNRMLSIIVIQVEADGSIYVLP